MSRCVWVWVVVLLAGLSASGETQTFGWRRDGLGRFADATPPLQWSAQSNVVWKTALPRWSNASPVLADDRVFVCVEPNILVCLSLADGSIFWQAENSYASITPSGQADDLVEKERKGNELAGALRGLESEVRKQTKALKESPDDSLLKGQLAKTQAEIEQLRKELAPLKEYVTPVTHETNGYTSPTPVIHGGRVYALFGTGVAVCYDLGGALIWGRMAGKPVNAWGHSTSPVVAGGRLIVHIAETVTALNLDTGAAEWSASSESAWGTPAVAVIGGQEAVVTTGGDLLRAGDGARLSRAIGKIPWTSPVVDNGAVYVIDENGARAFRLPAAMTDPLSLEPLWKAAPNKDRYYASPVVHEGLIYAINRRAFFSVIDAATGEVVYAQRLTIGGCPYPSPVLAGRHLFVSSDNGVTIVLEPGRVYKEVGRNKLKNFRTSPVFRGNRLYIRTTDSLYCIGR